MRVTESFAVEATEEVRKDPRFDWYVNWLKSLENSKSFTNDYKADFFGLSSIAKMAGDWHKIQVAKILTLDEVYSRYGKEIYEANVIEQPFQGSIDLTKKDVDHLLWIYGRMIEVHGEKPNVDYMLKFAEIIDILDKPYKNESILKKIAEHKAKIEELEKQLR